MAARNIHHHLSHSSSLPLFDTSPFIFLLPFRSSLCFHLLLHLQPASIPSVLPSHPSKKYPQLRVPLTHPHSYSSTPLLSYYFCHSVLRLASIIFFFVQPPFLPPQLSSILHSLVLCLLHLFLVSFAHFSSLPPLSSHPIAHSPTFLPFLIIRLLPSFQSFYTSYPAQPNLH